MLIKFDISFWVAYGNHRVLKELMRLEFSFHHTWVTISLNNLNPLHQLQSCFEAI